jgi:hypothetical protein
LPVSLVLDVAGGAEDRLGGMRALESTPPDVLRPDAGAAML